MARMHVKPEIGASTLALLVAMLCSLSLQCAAVPRRAPADWYRVTRLDSQTYAIAEPKYWQQNVSYLLVGSRQAILFDTGPGIYSIKTMVSALTRLPVLVIPSHLHFDHVGRINEFNMVALLDTPPLRAQAAGGVFVDPPEQHMLTTPASFRVSRWIKDGEIIDLGGRQIQLISTPGHTPDSVTLIDALDKRVFTGDLVNRIVALYDVPGSNVGEAAESLRRILALLPPAGVAYEAHAERPLQRVELEQLGRGLDAIASGKATSAPMCLGGQPMSSYQIGAFTAVLPGFNGESLKPLKTPLTTLDWRGGACGAGH